MRIKIVENRIEAELLCNYGTMVRSWWSRERPDCLDSVQNRRKLCTLAVLMRVHG